MTICKTGEYVIQSIIFDKYEEHFRYSGLMTGTEKLELNQNAMTTRVAEEVFDNIGKHVRLHELILLHHDLFN